MSEDIFMELPFTFDRQWVTAPIEYSGTAIDTASATGHLKPIKLVDKVPEHGSVGAPKVAGIIDMIVCFVMGMRSIDCSVVYEKQFSILLDR
jgi:hypothetical protein